LADRSELRALAWRVWREAPGFGVGGWDSAIGPGSIWTQAEWGRLHHEGWANVHCDALQFLVEFGLAGFLLGAVVLACLVVPFARVWEGRNGLFVFGAIAWPWWLPPA
jgi:hypothetical protein